MFAKNDGLQNQAVIYRARALADAADVLIDPNAFSADGTIALGELSFTDDGRLMAYSLSVSGSDWREWHVREVATGRDLPDLVQWGKFSTAAWTRDGSGFYYARFAAPGAGDERSGVNRNQQVFFHRLGAPQEADELVYERPDHPDWFLSAEVTDDGRFLLVYQHEGTEPKNRLFVQDLSRPGATIEPLLDRFDASYQVVGNDGDTLYVLTDNDAPRKRLVAIDVGAPAQANWRILIAEGEDRDVLATVSMLGSRFVATWQVDASHRLRVYGLDGVFEREIALPTLGSVGFSSKRRDTEGFYGFASFSYPATIFRYDPETGRSELFRRPDLHFEPDDFETTQVFYVSRDGTRVPLFITGKKDRSKTSEAPTFLYGYGGFNISVTPAFSPSIVAWLELGGLYAVANIRGGGEYGQEWHDAGRLAHKQNVFDDFIAAAEYLVRERHTSTSKLAIAGGSNGGLLVGAAMTQRPDLFAAVLPAVGVLDMLRFHLFTIGWAWKSDYGSSETREGFETLFAYSPLHRLAPGTAYPATLVTTADHDDRVVPAHSFKFAAALQAAHSGPAPVLIRIETRAGHGAGTPTSKLIDERADVLAFLVKVLGMNGEK